MAEVDKRAIYSMYKSKKKNKEVTDIEKMWENIPLNAVRHK